MLVLWSWDTGQRWVLWRLRAGFINDFQQFNGEGAAEILARLIKRYGEGFHLDKPRYQGFRLRSMFSSADVEERTELGKGSKCG